MSLKTNIVSYYGACMESMRASKNMSAQHDPIRAFRIPDELYNDLRMAAGAKDLNLSQAVRRAIKEWTRDSKETG